VGSIPASRTKALKVKGQIFGSGLFLLPPSSFGASPHFANMRRPAIMRARAAVAQLDRVLGYEPRGRGFDSCQPHQSMTSEKPVLRIWLFAFVRQYPIAAT
jgi:hypothetical protein